MCSIIRTGKKVKRKRSEIPHAVERNHVGVVLIPAPLRGARQNEISVSKQHVDVSLFSAGNDGH